MEEGLDDAGLVAASLRTPIPETNRGYALLQQMGWKGQGLGRQEQGNSCFNSGQSASRPSALCGSSKTARPGNSPSIGLAAGILEPVATGVDPGMRMGLGKQEQENFYMAADNVVRRRLETEVQAEEDEARRSRRQVRTRHLDAGCMLSWWTTVCCMLEHTPLTEHCSCCMCSIFRPTKHAHRVLHTWCLNLAARRMAGARETGLPHQLTGQCNPVACCLGCTLTQMTPAARAVWFAVMTRAGECREVRCHPERAARREAEPVLPGVPALVCCSARDCPQRVQSLTQWRLQTCSKQYKTAGELEVHLSSYDHHHRKVRRLQSTAPSLQQGCSSSPVADCFGHVSASAALPAHPHRAALAAWAVSCSAALQRLLLEVRADEAPPVTQCLHSSPVLQISRPAALQRLLEVRADEAQRSKGDRERRERKRVDKEARRLSAQ